MKSCLHANWPFIYQDVLTDEERALIRSCELLRDFFRQDRKRRTLLVEVDVSDMSPFALPLEEILCVFAFPGLVVRLSMGS